MQPTNVSDICVACLDCAFYFPELVVTPTYCLHICRIPSFDSQFISRASQYARATISSAQLANTISKLFIEIYSIIIKYKLCFIIAELYL